MNKYNNSKLYRVINNERTMEYIGSSIKKELDQILIDLIKKYKLYKQGQITKYTSIFKLFDNYPPEQCSIELIENYKCASQGDLVSKFTKLVESSIICVNQKKQGRLNTFNLDKQSIQIEKPIKKIQITFD